jgi:hypothetical protein
MVGIRPFIFSRRDISGSKDIMLKILPSKIRGFTHPIKPYTLSLSLFGEAFFFIGETFATK